ncbi:MAG: outer membrane beta-barrel protein, partial [Mycobacterium sp.]
AGRNTVSGGASAFERLIDRPQVNGSVSLMKAGWMGSHTFRIGGEYMYDRVDAPFYGYRAPCNCVSTLNNGVPAQVQLFGGSNVSKTALRTIAGFVDDTWRLSRAITLSLGLRLDRYQPVLPEQEGPDGQLFGAIDPVLTFNNWGPRAGIAADLTGDGKTALKVHYGRFWVYPAPIFVATFNPNASGWSRTYQWTDDANGNGQWDPGEEGALTSVVGGSSVTRLDPDISNAYVDQASVFVEREMLADFGIRTGVVGNRKRRAHGTIDINRPLDAYSASIDITDPGPDGRLGSADDGAALTGYQLGPGSLSAAPLNLTTNLPHADSDYYTWELTATRRPGANGSMMASITHTWTREAVLGSGSDFTPNALINATGYQDRFRTWQAKVNGTINLPLDTSIMPVLRHQSGGPYARTFVQAFNYGTAIVRTEPIAANRTPNITLVDLRVQKAFRWQGLQVTGLFDIYNLFNSSADQMLTTSSGAAWQRPTAITGPRVARIGARFKWS